MSERLIQILHENGYEFHQRARGSSGRCWIVGSKRATWDYGRKQARLFAALAEDSRGNVEVYFKFSVSSIALASQWVQKLTGDPEKFLVEAGLLRFRRLLSANDAVSGEYPEQMLLRHSPPEEFVMEDEEELETEIRRVYGEILSLLRRNAYKGIKRTAKQDLAQAICTADTILNQTLRTLEGRGFIKGALSGQMKITAAGEAEFERIQAHVAAQKGGEPTLGQPVRADEYDVFISHASEDKEAFVRPLAEALRASGLKVWYDEFSLRLGDSLRESIDKGLAGSRFGVVVLSHNFFAKNWPQKELDGLFAKTTGGQKVILPVWHELSADDLTKYSPMLAGIVAVKSSDGLDRVVTAILREVRDCL